MSRPSIRRLLLLCSIGGAVGGCGNGGEQHCEMDSDCPSHFCKADGTCGAEGADAGTDVPDDGMVGPCNANHDGTIDLAELPFMAGRMGTFRIATDVTWSTAGMSMPNGSRKWDLSVQLASDADHLVTLASPAGEWWKARFPDAAYATELLSTSDLRGVFGVAASGLALQGVVSPEAGAFRTELTYDPPAKILALPLMAGSTWSSTSTVSGTAQGAIVAYTERYESRVDQVGTMKTPYGEFPVVRVATVLTRTAGFSTLLTKHTFTWLAECFGPVATVQSKDFESASEATDDAEVRRLAP